ncbi:hypothetical protein KQH40_00810 [bacterium]|nr:hypothetical protein [bacterium]
MSKTISKKVSQRVNASNLAKAFRMMGIEAQENTHVRLYGGQKELADINLPPTELKKLGINSAYGTGIGIQVDADGVATLRFDHFNEKTASTLSGLLPGLNQIGAAAADIQGYLSKGFELRPHIDLENNEYGVFLETKNQGRQHLGGKAWETGNDGGGLW